MIALGDTTYKDTFCQGGIRFDKMLTELGAKRAGEMLMHDASSGTLPEEVAAQWAVPWVEQHLASSSPEKSINRWQLQWKIALARMPRFLKATSAANGRRARSRARRW